MARTFGAKDKKLRKRRRDRKHKYVKRKGQWFPKKIRQPSRKTHLKLYFWKIEKMSLDGHKRWAGNLRQYAKKTVYKPVVRVDAPVERLSSVERIGQLALETIGYEGTFIMRGFSHGKTKTHYKQVRLAIIVIKKSAGDEMRAFVSETGRLSRYWFWGKV